MKKLFFILFTFSNSALLLLVLCLGSQNLNNRNSVNLIFSSTPPYPNGFILGISIILGVISGGSTSALIMLPKKINND